MPDVIEREVEKMARTILINGGMDPDTLVQSGEPRVYGTPHGRAFMVQPGAEEPLWRLYVAMARSSLALAREQLAAAPEPLPPGHARIAAELEAVCLDPALQAAAVQETAPAEIEQPKEEAA